MEVTASRLARKHRDMTGFSVAAAFGSALTLMAGPELLAAAAVLTAVHAVLWWRWARHGRRRGGLM